MPVQNGVEAKFPPSCPFPFPQPCTTPGTERCEEAVQALGKQYDIVINIQGDEPLIDPEIINSCVRALQSAPDAMYRYGFHANPSLVNDRRPCKFIGPWQ